MHVARSMLRGKVGVSHTNFSCSHAAVNHSPTDIIMDKPSTLSSSRKCKISLRNPRICTENLDDTASISSMDAVIEFQSATDADHFAWSNHDIESETAADHSVFSNQISFVTPLRNRRTSTGSRSCDVRSSMSMSIESPQLTTSVSTLISNIPNCPSPVQVRPISSIAKISQVRPISSIASSSLNLDDSYFRPIDSKSRQKQIQPLQFEKTKPKKLDFREQESLVMQRQPTAGTSVSTLFYKQSRNLFQHGHRLHQHQLRKQDLNQRVMMMKKQEEQRREQEDYSLRSSVMYEDREVYFTIPVCRENAQKVFNKFQLDQLCAFCFLDMGVILHECSGCERFYHPECGEKATLKFSGMFSRYCAFCVSCVTCEASLVGCRSYKCSICRIPRCDECIKNKIGCVCKLT